MREGEGEDGKRNRVGKCGEHRTTVKQMQIELGPEATVEECVSGKNRKCVGEYVVENSRT